MPSNFILPPSTPLTAHDATLNLGGARSRSDAAARFSALAGRFRDVARHPDSTAVFAELSFAGEDLLAALNAGLLPPDGHDWPEWYAEQVRCSPRPVPPNGLVLPPGGAVRVEPPCRLFLIYAENNLSAEAGFKPGELTKIDTRGRSGEQVLTLDVRHCGHLARCCEVIAKRIEATPAEMIRQLPARLSADAPMKQIVKAAEQAGAIILAAIHAGCIISNADLTRQIRAEAGPDAIHQNRGADGYSAEAHAFIFAAHRLLARNSTVVGTFSKDCLVYIGRGCPLIADALEQAAADNGGGADAGGGKVDGVIPKDLLTFKEAASHCKCSVPTIRRAVRKRGVLREYVGMVSRAELDAKRAQVVLRQHRIRQT